MTTAASRLPQLWLTGLMTRRHASGELCGEGGGFPCGLDCCAGGRSPPACPSMCHLGRQAPLFCRSTVELGLARLWKLFARRARLPLTMGRSCADSTGPCGEGRLTGRLRGHESAFPVENARAPVNNLGSRVPPPFLKRLADMLSLVLTRRERRRHGLRVS